MTGSALKVQFVEWQIDGHGDGTKVEAKRLQIRASEVVWRVVGDELVVLELATSTCLTLNGTARTLWERLVEGATQDDLETSLLDHYGVTKDRARSDVESFLEALLARQLLQDFA